MLTSISGYFNSSTESPLHFAMRKNQISEASKLLAEGANPSSLDSSGYSVIDRTIYSGKINELPSLFSAPRSNNMQIAANENKEIEFLANSKNLSSLKQTLSSFSPEMLSDTSSEPYESYMSFLKNSKSLSTPLGSQLIHLIALFGNEASLKLALKVYPEMLNATDNLGNTPLHYSASNKDESCFVELVKEGSNLFSINHLGSTALGNLVNRVQKDDPLHWDSRDVFIFVAAWLPATFAAARNSGMMPDSLAPFLALEGMTDLVLNITSTYPWLTLLCEQFNSTPKKALFTLALLGTAWVPVLSLPVRTYIAYTFFNRAYQGIKTSWHELAYRPFQAVCLAGMKTSNAIDAGKSLYSHYYVAKVLTKAATLFNEFAGGAEEFTQDVMSNCGYNQEMFTNKGPVSSPEDLEINPKFPEYVTCTLDTFETSYNKTLNKVPEFKDFLNEAFYPFATEAAANCPAALKAGGEQGKWGCIQAHMEEHINRYFLLSDSEISSGCGKYETPVNIKSLTVNERIEAAKIAPKCLQAGLDIILQKNVCEANPKKPCRNIASVVHPDKHNPNEKEFYESLFDTASTACKVLRDTFKREC
jgi:ankyrin repeat protein